MDFQRTFKDFNVFLDDFPGFQKMFKDFQNKKKISNRVKEFLRIVRISKTFFLLFELFGFYGFLDC